MERTQALKDVLESLAKVYNDEGGVPVEFGEPSRAVPAGNAGPSGLVSEDTVVVSPNVREELGRNLSEAQELRCIANTLSHEIEHLRKSDLTCKEEFIGEYEDDGHGRFAGSVINILEDQYIDHTRTQRFPGLRKAQAFVIDTLMDNHHRWPRVDNIDNRPKAMMEGLRQVAFAGGAKGGSEADEWLREYLARCIPLIEEVRKTHDQAARKDLAHAVMDISQEYLPEGQDVDIPDECEVCGSRPPVIYVPILGAVCEQCAPTGHGMQDGDGDGTRPEDVDGPVNIQPVPGGDEDDDGGGPADGDGGGTDQFGGDSETNADGSGGDDGDGGAPGEQSPISADGDDDQIDPTEWDWLDLGDHNDHTVSIVDDGAEV